MEYNEIKYNLINSALAGGLILVGALSTGDITWQSFLAAFMVGVGVALTKFKDYWNTMPPAKKGQSRVQMFNFI